MRINIEDPHDPEHGNDMQSAGSASSKPLTVLRRINLIAAGINVLLAIAAFVGSGGSDAAGRGMAQSFTIVLVAIAAIGGLLACFKRWTTQLLALLIVSIPLLFTASQQLDGYRYARERAAEADGSAHFDSPGMQQIAAAVHAGDLDALRRLLPAQDAHIDEVGPGHRTALDVAVDRFMWARTDGNLAVIDYLLEQGADPNVRAAGRKPLITETDVIVTAPIFRMLMAHGADPNAVDLKGQPVLSNVLHGYGEETELVRLLLEAGADPNKHGVEGGMPLARAAQRMHWASCLLLLEHGADPNLPETAAFWEHFDYNAASYRKYRDAPSEFVALSQHPAIRAARPE